MAGDFDFREEMARIDEFRNRMRGNQDRDAAGRFLAIGRVSREEVRGFVSGLRGPGGPVVQFEFDQRQNFRLMAYLEVLAQGGPRIVASELNKAALLWQREIRRHTPVDAGLLRQSWDVAFANAGQGSSPSAAVGTNVYYGIYIEFGTELIAGGDVLRWQPGDPPILDWPAKRKDARKETTISIDQTGGAAGRGRNKAGQFTTKKSADATEFMPPMRASWPLVAPVINDRLRRRLAKLMKDGRIAA